MRKILVIVVLFLLMNTSAYTDDIKDFHIENISRKNSSLVGRLAMRYRLRNRLFLIVALTIFFEKTSAP